MERIYRSKEDSILGGVCSGMALHFRIDPVLIRLLWVALFFCGSIGFFVYLIAWIIIPVRTTPLPETKTKRLMRSKDECVLAGICGGLGQYFNKDPVIFRIILLVLLFSFGIGLGIYLLGILLIPNEK